MFDTAFMLAPQHLAAYLHDGGIPEPHGNGHRFATNTVYETAQGQILIAATNRGQQKRLWAAMGRPELASEDRAARQKNREQQKSVLTEVFKTRTAAEWESFLQGHHIPAARVRNMAEAVADPQFAAREITHRHEMVPGVDGPFSVAVSGFKFAHGGPAVTSPPPRVGEHTALILEEVGYSSAEIAALQASGAVAQRERE
jgi:crotonobetainyl-CoA:carnitine CoA-transferase CaiB-like acyl-CoA transferase